MKPDSNHDLPIAAWDEQLIYESDVVSIGRFRARPDEPHFRFSGLPGAHLFVFPYHEVWIENHGDDPFVADRSCITFYNPSQLYRRRAISDRGDRGDWFALAPGILEDIVARHDREGAPGDERLFRFPAGPADDPSFLFQRSLLARIEDTDPLLVDEGSIRLAERVVELAYRRRYGSSPRQRSSEATRRHRETVEATRQLLALRFRDSLSLEQIAKQVGCSLYHLCRLFRRQTGVTLHRYRARLRQRQALQELLDGRPDLTRLALELGYSSHSHFTQDFRKTFGVPPSRVRESEPAALLSQLPET
jgi:AraC family transcriptional regulator